jgi:hypothetical protein
VLRVLCFLCFVSLLSLPAAAHTSLLSSGTYVIEGRRASGELFVDPAQLVLDHAVEVRGAGLVCPLHIVSVHTEGPMARIVWKTECDTPVRSIRLPWVPKSAAAETMHTHAASVRHEDGTYERTIHTSSEDVYTRASAVAQLRQWLARGQHPLLLVAGSAAAMATVLLWRRKKNAKKADRAR